MGDKIIPDPAGPAPELTPEAAAADHDVTLASEPTAEQLLTGVVVAPADPPTEAK